MISYDKALKYFNEYLEQYDRDDGSIKLKIIHTMNVVDRCNDLATALNFNSEDISLAKVIGLLHDIGRFEQIKVNSDFNDSTLDHAVYGVKVLFDDNLIRRFVSDNKYDNIIKEAILNHNRFEIDKSLNDREMLFARLIRDADKLDNFRVREFDKIGDMFPHIYNPDTYEYETVSDKVYNDFLECKCILLKDRKTLIDYWICVLAFIFDFNFSFSYKYIKDHDYVNKLVDRIDYKNKDTKVKMEKLRECALNYIDSKLDIS